METGFCIKSKDKKRTRKILKMLDALGWKSGLDEKHWEQYQFIYWNPELKGIGRWVAHSIDLHLGVSVMTLKDLKRIFKTHKKALKGFQEWNDKDNKRIENKHHDRVDKDINNLYDRAELHKKEMASFDFEIQELKKKVEENNQVMSDHCNQLEKPFASESIGILSVLSVRQRKAVCPMISNAVATFKPTIELKKGESFTVIKYTGLTLSEFDLRKFLEGEQND